MSYIHFLSAWVIGPICRCVPFHTERSRNSFFWSTRLRDWCNLSDSWNFCQTLVRKASKKKSPRRDLNRGPLVDENFTKQVFFHCTSRPPLSYYFCGSLYFSGENYKYGEQWTMSKSGHSLAFRFQTLRLHDRVQNLNKTKSPNCPKSKHTRQGCFWNLGS